MRWLVTGAGGALGTDLVRVLGTRGERVTALPRAALDITDADEVDAAVARWAGTPDGPDAPDEGAPVLLNAAAFTAVDLAESDPAAGAAAHAVNAVAPGLLAAACARSGVRMVHVSTDYVFAGDRTDGRGYLPDDAVAPASVYGATKAEGERRVRDALEAHHVVRTAWVYGGTGNNFVRTVARLLRERDGLDVVDDQHGSPTWSADLAAALVDLGAAGAAPGTLHHTGAGRTTWCGFARAVAAAVGTDPARVRACGTERFPRPAPRPAWSVLDTSSWPLPSSAPRDWREALAEALVRHPDLVTAPAA